MGITSNYHTWNNVIITFISFYEERQTLPASPSSLIRCQSRSTPPSRPAPDSLTASAWSHLTCAAEERNQKLGNDPPWQRKPFPTNLSTGKYLVTNKIPKVMKHFNQLYRAKRAELFGVSGLLLHLRGLGALAPGLWGGPVPRRHLRLLLRIARKRRKARWPLPRVLQRRQRRKWSLEHSLEIEVRNNYNSDLVWNRKYSYTTDGP